MDPMYNVFMLLFFAVIPQLEDKESMTIKSGQEEKDSFVQAGEGAGEKKDSFV